VDHAHLDWIAASATSSLDAMPILLQAGIILLLTDVVQYWGHRLFHRSPLWRFHCIHHAPKQVDWLTSVRFHPVNFILYSTLINLLISLVGFSPKAFFILVPFNMLSSLLVHANLNWTFGPFRYVLVSPVFHRWHHTYADQGGNKNFAPTFPFLDLAFGTFHMPKGQIPCVFGIVDRQVPNSLFGQLCHPFRRLTHTPPLRRAEQPLGGESTLHRAEVSKESTRAENRGGVDAIAGAMAAATPSAFRSSWRLPRTRPSEPDRRVRRSPRSGHSRQ
jgi:sterol desaturase/sphingolipid hydroxylase (fatty acid hydroxylase superfamily)